MGDKTCGTCLFYGKTRECSYSDLKPACTSRLHGHLCKGAEDVWPCWKERGEEEPEPTLTCETCKSFRLKPEKLRTAEYRDIGNCKLNPPIHITSGSISMWTTPPINPGDVCSHHEPKDKRTSNVGTPVKVLL